MYKLYIGLGVTFLLVNILVNLILPAFDLWLSPKFIAGIERKTVVLVCNCLFNELLLCLLLQMLVFIWKVCPQQQTSYNLLPVEITNINRSELI